MGHGGGETKVRWLVSVAPSPTDEAPRGEGAGALHRRGDGPKPARRLSVADFAGNGPTAVP